MFLKATPKQSLNTCPGQKKIRNSRGSYLEDGGWETAHPQDSCVPPFHDGKRRNRETGSIWQVGKSPT